MKQINPDIVRLLDANANRAVEGIRVLEESARMLLDDDVLTTSLKSMRHDLVTLMNKMSVDCGIDFLAARGSDRDVLRQGETATEATRETVVSVLRANAGRVKEALRAIEEYGKLVMPGVSVNVKDIRFRLYDMEKSLVMRFQRRFPSREQLYRLFVVLDAAVLDAAELIASALKVSEKGATAIGYRNDTADDSAWCEGLEKLMIAIDARVPVIAFGRPGLAKALGADGFHTGKNERECTVYRNLLGEKMLIGYYGVMPENDFPGSADFITFQSTGGDGNECTLPEPFHDNETALPIPVMGILSSREIERAGESGWRCFMLEYPRCPLEDVRRAAAILDTAQTGA